VRREKHFPVLEEYYKCRKSRKIQVKLESGWLFCPVSAFYEFASLAVFKRSLKTHFYIQCFY